jgi:hypothetical protein
VVQSCVAKNAQNPKQKPILCYKFRSSARLALQKLKIAKQNNLSIALEISHKLVQLRSLGVAVRCETAGSATAFILLRNNLS